MKKTIKSILLMATSGILFSSCATIIGGSSYWALVNVKDHPNAKISYQGINRGVGSATFLVQRKYANRFSIDVEEPGCKEATVTFNRREFRAFACLGTIIGWTGITTTGIPLPWGVVVDGITGAFWKPDVTEKGVSKMDYKHFHYTIDYKGCKN